MNEIKKEITNLNQRFFLILENFVPDYVSYLKNPKNSIYINKVERIKQTVNEINSECFVLKNKMEVEIDTNETLSNKLTLEIDKLKKENILLKKKRNSLEKTSLTSEGLYDDELDWYKKQIKTIMVMIIGIMLCGFFLRSFKLNIKQYVIVIVSVLLFGIIFENILITIYNKIKDS
tara:strand:+ start:173 stop:700 length:528 start_codon:yes stop_codon:yes gene_type:complete